jgi:O-glycosyl hydrolase
MRRLTLCLLICCLILLGKQGVSQQPSGSYRVRQDEPRQEIWGLGVEIQNDAIGSGNHGMPDEVIAVPNNLTRSERQRFYTHILKGFRYVRLAMGLYFRGLDSSRQHIVERYPHQVADLKEMIDKSGIEGISMEYWSPAPYWKSTNSYIGGTLRSDDAEFLNAFGNALREDVHYMERHGIKISMWGLQNEPGVGNPGNLSIGGAPPQSYSTCFYSPELYYKTFKAVAPKIREAAPDALIMVDSWAGNSGLRGKRIQKDTGLLRYVDAWVYHRVGSNSNLMIKEAPKYRSNTFGKPVFQNEFEYQHPSSDTLFVNTAQNIMNWFTFANSPTWFWLHALKPTTNVEASGYCLGFWRPQDDNDFSRFPNIKKGHWDYNPLNFNAIAGFLKYMPWNSRRYAVEEDTIRRDNRILAFKTPSGRLVIVLTNRSGRSFTFHVNTPGKMRFRGYRYTASSRDFRLGSLSGPEISPTLPDLSVEFWVEQ